MMSHKNYASKDFSKILEELEEFSKKHDICFTNVNFIGIWTEGNYRMETYGSIYHNKFKNMGFMSGEVS